MKLERKCTLTVIKALPPKLLKHYIEEFEIPSPYKEILTVAYLENYKGYSYKITRDNKKMISKVKVDYNQMDITAYLRDNPTQEEYFMGDKLTVEGILDIYSSMQIGCEK